MKRLIKVVVVMVLLVATVGIVNAQHITGQASGDKTPIVLESNVREYTGGEHTPLVFSGTETLNPTGGTSTTHWMQIGYNVNGGYKSNLAIQRYNPEIFTLLVGLRDESDDNDATDDSVGVSAIRFETAIDTTDDPEWNADSTNLFVADGNYTHSQYGIWMFEDIAAVDSASAIIQRIQAYPLRILHGGWVRFVFTNSTVIEDTTFVDWSLVCEN